MTSSALSSGEQAALEAEQAKQRGEPRIDTEAAEQETGTTAIPRDISSSPDPSSLDPRFDRDDLRQGKPPPAARGHPHLSSVGKLPGQALKLPGHAIKVPGKGLRKVKKIVVGKNGEKQEVEVDEEVDEAGQGVETGEEKEHRGFMDKVLHPHGGHKS
ncbi:unnamed protein product [Sympodiomycopsis kandeliae]